jgi:hypothetical protein
MSPEKTTHPTTPRPTPDRDSQKGGYNPSRPEGPPKVPSPPPPPTPLKK